MTRLLALDTSTLTASVAVLGAHRDVALDRPVGSHSDDLMELVDRALAEAGCALRDLDAVAVGVGPGSFTGLRIAMSTAKGLCFAAGLPMWAVSSLAALALDALDAPSARGARSAAALLVPVQDALRGEVFTGLYRAEGAVVTALGPDRIASLDRLPALLAQERAGAGLAEALLFGAALGPHAVALARAGSVLGDARTTPSARSIARLALAGPREDVLRVGTPVYIRPAEAEAKFPAGNPGGPSLSKKP